MKWNFFKDVNVSVNNEVEDNFTNANAHILNVRIFKRQYLSFFQNDYCIKKNFMVMSAIQS